MAAIASSGATEDMAAPKPIPSTGKDAQTVGYKLRAGSSRSTLGPAVGVGRVKIGALNHTGYDMSDPNHFYRHFIVEFVPNYVHHHVRNASWANSDKHKLFRNHPVRNKHPRMENGDFFWSPWYGVYQLPKNTNVMYTRARDGIGPVNYRETLLIDRNNGDDFNIVRWNYVVWRSNQRNVRPYYVAFPFPAAPEEFVWIDVNWPIRSIMFPVSLVCF
jgi:hypothetical protein